MYAMRVIQMRKDRKDDLDTETTFADMNVEGMRGYNPDKKDGKQKEKLNKKEQRKMILGAYAAFLPVIGIIIAVGLFIVLLAYLWLG